MDRGPWWAIVRGMAKSQTQLSTSRAHLFLYFGLPAWHVGFQFPSQESNPCPLQWKHGVLGRGCQGSPLATIFHMFSFSKKLPTLPGNHQAGNSSQRTKLHEASLRSLIPSVAKTAPSLLGKSWDWESWPPSTSSYRHWVLKSACLEAGMEKEKDEMDKNIKKGEVLSYFLLV